MKIPSVGCLISRKHSEISAKPFLAHGLHGDYVQTDTFDGKVSAYNARNIDRVKIIMTVGKKVKKNMKITKKMIIRKNRTNRKNMIIKKMFVVKKKVRGVIKTRMIIIRREKR